MSLPGSGCPVTSRGHVARMAKSNATGERDERRSTVARVLQRIQKMKAKPASEGRDVHVPGDELFLDPFRLGGTSSR